MPEINPELEARIKGFNEKFFPLLGEFKLGLGAESFITPDGRVAARPILVDATKAAPAETAAAAAPEGGLAQA